MEVREFELSAITPLLRIFDAAKAKEFYVGYLGFRLDWEHRHEPDMPLYAQVSLGRCALHLTEHHGDGTPGSAMRIETAKLAEYHRYLTAKHYGYARPGLEQAFGCLEVRVVDPFGNRLTFFERLGGRSPET
ncbi:glyoxalase superfamily protein [Cohnella hongkongensis]|uniref:Bleomycin resistance protein n=1 Tax=Cohnella hongkongensis TaxID=178337 RepID=A0ABV9FCN0_9BACL